MNRNGWPTSIGIGGRLRSEWVADMARNTHTISVVSFRKINYDVYIKSEHHDFACEGFEHLMQPDNTLQLPSAVIASTCNAQIETVEELRDRLKSEGKRDKDIAQLLKQKSPQLSHYDMYKLVLEAAATRTYTYRHQCRLAKALLE